MIWFTPATWRNVPQVDRRCGLAHAVILIDEGDHRVKMDSAFHGVRQYDFCFFYCPMFRLTRFGDETYSLHFSLGSSRNSFHPGRLRRAAISAGKSVATNRIR